MDEDIYAESIVSELSIKLTPLTITTHTKVHDLTRLLDLPLSNPIIMATQSPKFSKAQKLTAEQQAFKNKVEPMRREVPRFLFRYWSPSSGGGAKLNTVKAITPLAFLNTQNLPSFYQMPQSKIGQIAHMHLIGGFSNQTVFSSWSQSIRIAWGMGKHRSDSYISILDTHKLPDQNVILHTAHTAQLFGTSTYLEEFLAFGVISGDCYKAVPLQEFRQYMTTMVALSAPGITITPVEKKINEAIRIAKIYGPAFAVVVATYLLAQIAKDNDTPTIMTALSKMTWPDMRTKNCSVSSITDPSEKSYFRYTDAWKAAQMLQDLALRQYCQSDLHLGDSELMKEKLATILAAMPSKLNTPKVPQPKPSNNTMPKPKQTAKSKAKAGTKMIVKTNDPVLASSRMTREMKNLYIDMIGWENTVEDCMKALSIS